MVARCRTPEQTAFLTGLIPEYYRHAEAKKLKDFWTTVTEDWFKRYPLEDPPAALVEKLGSQERAVGAFRGTRIKQIKRFFANQGDTGVSGRKNLHLDEPRARKRSEVQSYMILFYESRIRPTVLARWASDKIQYLGSKVELNIPESEILPEDSHLLKDTVIPISYKNMIAQELWDAEDEAIKREVRSQRQYDTVYKTVYNTDGKERMGVIREYTKNISSLHRNMGNVLRNVERKCAGKGIMWVACPSPTAGGQPVGYFQCVGETASGKDFETFVGAEKAKEIRGLFGAWVQKIYPSSEWSMFSIDQPIDDLETEDKEDTLEEGAHDDAPPDTTPPAAPEQPEPAAAPADRDLSMTADNTIAELQVAKRTDGVIQPVPPPPVVSDIAATSPPLSTLQEITSTEGTVVDPANRVVGDSTTPDVDPEPTAINPSLLMEAAPQMTRMRASRKAPCPALRGSPIPGVDDPSLFNLPNDCREPIWMKKKSTLRYFRSVFKMGNLSGLISNWYRLEEALGFPEQTQRGFPTKSRPEVVGVFLKNGHNYKRDYGLDAHSLGLEISEWWRDINKTGHVGFGGTTGIYTMVVLMLWWCSLLKDRPDSERADYVVVVEELNRAILAALQQHANPRGAKRARAEELPSRKRSKI